jgi:hypothetical protein
MQKVTGEGSDDYTYTPPTTSGNAGSSGTTGSDTTA